MLKFRGVYSILPDGPLLVVNGVITTPISRVLSPQGKTFIYKAIYRGPISPHEYNDRDGVNILVSTVMAGQPTPPLTYPPRNKGLIRPY